MNKLIATIALAALAFTSCIKENDTWKEMLPVQPGMYIYQLATDQDKLAMRPANAALRLAMLLAEADKQGEDVLSADLKEIVVKKGDASIKVWETLFGAHTKLERQGEDYLITYSDEAQLPDRFFMAGSVLVKTNGTKVLNQSSYSAPWTVEMQDLKVFAYTNTGLRSAFNFDGGETTLYFDGADSYIIGASSFRILKDVTLPALAPALFSTGALCFATSMGAFGTAFTLATDINVLPITIYTEFTLSANIASAAMLSVVLGLITWIMLVAARYFSSSSTVTGAA